MEAVSYREILCSNLSLPSNFSIHPNNPFFRQFNMGGLCEEYVPIPILIPH